MATAERRDPFRSFNFQLEIDGVPLGAFSEASGLTAEGDAVDYREAPTCSSNVRKLVGPAQVHEHHAEARLHAGQIAVGLVQKHRQRQSRPAQRHHHPDERRREQVCAGTPRTPGSTRSKARALRQPATKSRWSRWSSSTKG